MRRWPLTFCLLALAGCLQRAPAPPPAAAGREMTLLAPGPGALAAAVPPVERAEALGPADPLFPPPYRVKPGDVLEISVVGEPDTARQVTVGPDGRINYLTVKDLPAAGLTFAELRSRLVEALSRYYLEPEVEVACRAYSGNTVTVLGAVNRPGRLEIRQKTRLLDVIAMAGGIKEYAHVYGGYSAPGLEAVADLERAVLLRGNRVVPVDFKALLGGSPQEMLANNVPVQPGDTVYIPSGISLDNKVFVLGMVNRPGVVRFSGGISFLEAVAEAGGIPVGAWERRAYIVRGRLSDPTLIPINLRSILTGRSRDVALRGGDIVFIPKTPLKKLNEIAGQLVPLLGTLDTGLSVRDRLR